MTASETPDETVAPEATDAESTADQSTTVEAVEAAVEAPPEPVDEAPKAAAPRPRAPQPRAPKPGSFRAPSPVQIAEHATHPVKVPVVEDVTAEQIAAAVAFGKVTDGIASVVDGENEYAVGPAAGDAPLEPYARAYYELVATVERFHARLTGAELSPKDIDDSLAAITAALAEPKVVGDLAAVRQRMATLTTEAEATRDRLVEERRRAREEALAARESVVARAEALAAKPEAQVHWKNDTAELRALLDEWKEAQRSGVRVPKDAERALWKRFTHARSSFEKARKHHFSELDSANSAVAGRKEELVARAEELALSTDWDRTARAFRDLMNEWRAAGRGRKSVDDALWKRFQGAQDAFFEARRTEADAEEAALSANVAPKTRAVEEAEALLPVTDLTAAKAALRAIQDRFEAAGRVPRADAAALTRRMGAVEKAVRDAEDAAWNSRNPEIEARATGAAAQLRASIKDLEDQLARATTASDKKKVQEALDARKAWLAQIEGVVS